MLVPFLAVVLQVVRADDTHRRLDTKRATTYIFSAMWTPVIMLLLGGFTIAAALSKYSIAKLMATFVLSKAGTRPRTVLITNMFVALVASMWISNVAAPVLCFSIIQVCFEEIDIVSPANLRAPANTPKSSCRFQFFQSPHTRHCPRVEHWRRGLTHRFSAKHNSSTKHAP